MSTKENGSMQALSVYSYWMLGPRDSKQGSGGGGGIIVMAYFWKNRAEVSGMRAETLYLFQTKKM